MKSKTQNEVVLSYLKTFGALTTREAVLKLDIICLPKRIEELRKSGVAIKTDYKVSANGRKYGVYSLVEEEA